MIRLRFNIESFYWNDDYTQVSIKHRVVKSYPEETTFKKVLLKLYEEFGINNSKKKNYFINDLNKTFWKKHFKKSIYNHIDYELVDYEKLSIIELENQFEISKLCFNLVINLDGIGACVGEKQGIRFEFHYNEKDIHHNAHIHCTYSGITTRVELKTLRILDKPFKKSKMDRAIDLIKKNQDALLDYWEKSVIKGESIKFKMEI